METSYLKLGQQEEAIEFWKKALNAGGDEAVLEQKIKNKSLVEKTVEIEN